MSSDAPSGVRGTLYIVSAPSGAGKTSLVRALIATDRQLSLSVSHTTRARRPGEVDGDHYHFVDQDRFIEMRERGEFLEHASVFGHFYGTARAQVEAQLEDGADVILEIDWQGARQVRTSDIASIGIFVLPPSIEVLAARLNTRGQDDPRVIAARMRAARDELSHYHEFDYLVVNDDFDTALNQVRAVLLSERLRCGAQEDRHRKLLDALLAGRSVN